MKCFRKKFKMNLSQGISDEYNPPLMNRDIIKVNSSSINSIRRGSKDTKLYLA